MLAMLLAVAFMGLATPLLTVLFAIFALNVFSFRGRSKSFAIALFLITVAGICLTATFFALETVAAAPKLAERLVPKVLDLARFHEVELPFTDVQSMMHLIRDEVLERFGLLGSAGTTLLRQVAFVVIGIVVAISLFENSTIVIDREKHTLKNNLYLLTADEVGKRFELFYKSFHMVMGAQIVISTINTVFTGIFLFSTGYPYPGLLVGVTFLCGLLPILGNILSNTIIVSVGLTVDLNHAFGALAFLVIIHKFEYFLNSKIIGKRIQNPMWMTLLALVVGERLMGVPGMILAPVVLHYIKSETSNVAVTAETGGSTPTAEPPPAAVS